MVPQLLCASISFHSSESLISKQALFPHVRSLTQGTLEQLVAVTYIESRAIFCVSWATGPMPSPLRTKTPSSLSGSHAACSAASSGSVAPKRAQCRYHRIAPKFKDVCEQFLNDGSSVADEFPHRYMGQADPWASPHGSERHHSFTISDCAKQFLKRAASDLLPEQTRLSMLCRNQDQSATYQVPLNRMSQALCTSWHSKSLVNS